LQHALRDTAPLRQSFSASATTWAVFYMFHAAMRLVAPAYLFGLAGVDIDSTEEEDESIPIVASKR
jgi:hypothetical protein